MKIVKGTAVEKPLKPEASSFMSSSRGQQKGHIVLHGPPGVGKSFCAATISKHWPAELPAKKPVELSDCIWLSFDAGATDGFQAENIEVDTIDMVGLMNAEGIEKGRDAMVAMIRDNPDIENIIVDTVSMFDKLLNDYCDRTSPLDKTGNKDKFAMYRNIFNSHKRFHSVLRSLGKRIVYLCHSKAVFDSSDSQTIRRQAAEAIGFDVQPDITGQARTVYIGDASLEAVITLRRTPGVKGPEGLRRILHPYGSGEFEGKNRWHSILTMEEEAHLGKILRKVMSK